MTQNNNEKQISIIVPTLNEEGNVKLLIEQINKYMVKGHITYEIIFIDDHSTDNTESKILHLSDQYPIRFYKKVGNRGKAQSIIEGFNYVKYENICMIDADLQYPPKAIPGMLKLITEEGADVVLTNRNYADVSILRKIPSHVFKFLFVRILHGLDNDVQSGLKVFRTEVIKDMVLNPSPWTFDLEFLLIAKKRGYKIRNYDIMFVKRHSGEAKINVLQATYEIGLSAVKLKLKNI